MNTKLRRVFTTTISNNQLSKSPSYPKSNRQTGAKNGVAAEQTWVLGDWRWGGGWQKLRFCSSCTLPLPLPPICGYLLVNLCPIREGSDQRLLR